MTRAREASKWVSTGVTSTEIDKLDGFTGTVDDLNYAKDLRATGVTDTEFDKLDGFTGTADDLNYAKDLRAEGVTTTEFDYLDGVTSGIQTQLDDFASNDDVTQTNIALLAFKTAVNGSLAKYSLQDQVIDEYVNATGIDDTPSNNHVLAGGAYSGIVSNYYGNGVDGAVTTSDDVTHAVQSRVGSYDGDMVLKQYTSLTISAGDTMTVDHPCRGMFIYVQGDCTINGTLSMTGRGAFADPTASGGSDGNAVNASGLQFGLITDSGSSSHTNAAASLNGCGTTVRTAFGNQSNAVSNGTIYTLVRQGANGAPQTATISGDTDGDGATGIAGSSGSTGQTGGGGSGTYMKEGDGIGSGGAGAYGSCFAGGSGGGGASNAPTHTHHGGAAVNWAGAGGAAASNGYPTGGGTGNPGGAIVSSGTSSSGNGGLIILIVGGSITVGGSGSIEANGVAAHNVSSAYQVGGGGSSGGGNVLALCKGTYTNGGTVQAVGGTACTVNSTNYDNMAGGAGGAGSVQAGGTLSDRQLDLILQSTDTTAEAAPTKADMVMLIEDAGSGVASLDTSSGNIKGWVSRYETDGTKTWTQVPLVDEGNWGTDKRILAAHDVTLTGTSGTQMAYKITTHSASAVYDTKIHATSIGWR